MSFDVLTIKSACQTDIITFLICHDAGLKTGTPLTTSHTMPFQVGSPGDAREHITFYAFIAHAVCTG